MVDRWRSVVSVALVACGAGAHAAGDAASAPTASADRARGGVAHVVAIDGTGYVPAALTVRRGDTITWINKDPFPHTVTARDGAFDSKSIGVGKSWRYVAREAGEFRYVCTLHPTMSATLKVE